MVVERGLHGDRHWPPDIAAGVLHDHRNFDRFDDGRIILIEFIFAHRYRDRRDDHDAVGPHTFGVAGIVDRGVRRFGPGADDHDTAFSPKATGCRGQCLALFARQAQRLRDHAHDNAVGTLVIEPLDLPFERGKINRVISVVGGLKDG